RATTAQEKPPGDLGPQAILLCPCDPGSHIRECLSRLNVVVLEVIAKSDFTVILNGVKDLKSLKIEILRFAQNDIFGQTGVLQ
ncbi:MAG: hypothetical protein ACLQED_03275, partial [Desulfobaccales bacterium]